MNVSSATAAEWLPDLSLPDEPAPKSKGKPCGLPEIRANGRELRDVSAEALEAINAANSPANLFARAGTVVRVDHAEDGRPMIIPVNDVHIRGEMTRAANFYKLSKSGHLARTAVSPPMDAAREILSRPVAELGFPPLEAIAEAPFIRPDGTIACEPGYDAATRTFYAPVGNMADFFVPERPTADDLDGARAFIEDALGEFPFADEASRQATGAAAITVLKLMTDPNVPAAVKLRAAECVFAHAIKGIELEDIETRVTELERAAGASKDGRRHR